MAKGCPTVYLVDASIYIFRSYFALPDNWHSDNGWPTSAVYGYTNWLLKLLEQQNPQYLAAAYDESLGSGFRHRLCPAYKANRELPDEALAFQLDACREVAQWLGIAAFASDEYEADDLLGTLAALCRSQGCRPVILSRDKDLAQLLQGGEMLWDFGSAEPRGVAELEAVFGVPLSRLADYLALIGDAVDNIPGVPGIGAKTAAAIFQRFTSVDELLGNLDNLAALPVRGAKTLAAKIEPYREQLLLARQLTEVCCNAPLATTPAQLQWQGVDLQGFAGFCNRMGLGDAVVRRAAALKQA